jgi:DNA-binding MarR family transcriptional regulator
MNRQLNQMSGGRRADFTLKQGQYLAFIDAYARLNRRPPAEADIQRYFGVTPPSVHQMILTLERAGLIRRRPGAPRSVEVLVLPEDLPVLQAQPQPVKTSVPRY